MTTSNDFENELGGWLREDAASRVPDHLGEVLVRTIATRQRPWWSSLRRWIPFEVRVPPAPLTRSGSWRPILIVATVALVIAVLLIVASGSRRALPPPFGLARNGTLLASADGDVFTVDPTTGQRTPLIAGPSFDFGPGFSRDGTKIAFARAVDNGVELVVAGPDGGNLRAITPPVDGLDGSDWSPDGSRIAYLSTPPGTTGHRINIVNVDGSDPSFLDVHGPANQISWLPPDGTEILFRREHLVDSDPPAAIFAVHPDGTGLRQLSSRPAVDMNDYQDVAVSPDGTRIAYRDVGLEQRFRVHTIDLQTGLDRALSEPSSATGEGGPVFSPDGRSIVYLRWSSDNSTQLVVVPADDSGFGIAIGPRGPLGPDGPTINNYGFTPDGAAVFANYDAEKLARLLPVDGSPGVVIARGELALVAFQRLAP
jgi:Tol biopolymer transport system component